VSLERKRGNTHGAAAFATLSRKRESALLALLVAYQVMWDYLDSLSEAGARGGHSDSGQLHLALVDALDGAHEPDAAREPDAAHEPRDYYACYPWRDDGGYLDELIETCRRCCRQLPSFHELHPLLQREARRIGVQAINHDRDPDRRAIALRKWAEGEYPGEGEASWFELAAAAGANLAIYALLALAAQRQCAHEDIARAYRAYFPWCGATATLLDSFVDQFDDREQHEHCYVAYYDTPEQATRRIGELLQRFLREAQTLPDGERHVLLAACMAAMYLSRDSARTPALKPDSRRIARAGGQLTRTLVPILRLWRIANGQSAT